MALKLSLAVFTVIASLASQSVAEDLERCGEAQYFPSDYTCYDDEILCPRTSGLSTFPCNGACYLREAYECNAGKLKLLPEATEPFTVIAHSTNPIFDGQVIKACGDYLAIGYGARQCYSCDAAVAPTKCSTYENQTVLHSDGSMGVDIKGGQYWYIDPAEGVLRFTAGGEENDESLAAIAGQDVTVYADGFFSYTGGSRNDWLACLRTLPGGNVGTSRSYRIYAPTKANLAREKCESIKLVAKTLSGRFAGAYKYE